jgi:hypothetical protein
MFSLFNRLMVPVLIVAVCKVYSATTAEPSSWIDSTEARYSTAAREYDPGALRTIAEIITTKPVQDQKSPRALLLLGFILWRQELIAYCSNTTADIKLYGKEAIEKLDEAEKAGADPYLTASHRALSCQLLAVQGFKNGAIYGPRAAKELKKAQRANPRGYYSLLIEAINANQAPSFAGGSPEKAVVLLEKMITVFPDSVDVKIHLAEAYGKVGRKDDAKRVILPIVKEYPANLLARKIAAKLSPK